MDVSSSIDLELISILINKLLKSESLEQLSSEIVYFRNVYAKIINPPKITHHQNFHQTQKGKPGLTFHRKIKKGSEFSQSQ